MPLKERGPDIFLCVLCVHERIYAGLRLARLKKSKRKTEAGKNSHDINLNKFISILIQYVVIVSMSYQSVRFDVDVGLWTKRTRRQSRENI